MQIKITSKLYFWIDKCFKLMKCLKIDKMWNWWTFIMVNNFEYTFCDMKICLSNKNWLWCKSSNVKFFACHKFYHVWCIARKLVCENKENFVYKIYYGMKMFSYQIIEMQTMWWSRKQRKKRFSSSEM
jgi:hypothetical protein